MKIKFNWGTGILGFLILFIIGVVVFYLYISNLDIKLVEKDYYEKELVYQQRIDKLNNTKALTGKIVISEEPGKLTLQFPSMEPGNTPEGNVLFYRPSDPDKDFTVPLTLNDSLQQSFDVSKISKGKWLIKLDWKMGGKEYYFEETVIIEY